MDEINVTIKRKDGEIHVLMTKNGNVVGVSQNNDVHKIAWFLISVILLHLAEEPKI